MKFWFQKVIALFRHALYSPGFIYFGILFAVCLPVFSLYRLVFLLKYSYRVDWDQVNPSLLAHALLLGIRFDLVSLAIVFGLFFLLSSVHLLNRSRLLVFFWSFIPLILILIMFVILITDIIYFEHANKHIGYEAYVFFGKDLLLIFASLWEENLPLFVFGFGGLFLLGFLLYKIYFRTFTYNHKPQSFLPSLFTSLLSFALAVILIRGGVQDSPIRASNAIISKNETINSLVLNGVYTAIVDLKSTNIPKSEKLGLLQSLAVVRNEIEYPTASFISDQYPLMRQTIPSPQTINTKLRKPMPKKPNIVLVMLENWTGKFVQPIGDGKVNGKEVTPYFSKLTQEGIFYRRFFASGGRTTNGMMSVLSGIPDRPGLTVVRSPQATGNYSGVASIFKQAGYSTLFVTGGDLSFDNKHTMMPHWGYDTILGLKAIESKNKYKIGAWGYDDADVYDVLHEELQKADPQTPFFATVLTLTTHYPYRAPQERFNIFTATDSPDFEFLNVYHYADWAISDFLNKAKNSLYFENTVFIFVADHTHHRYLSYYEDRNIPFLIYAPLHIVPELREDIASQLDVIPTIVGFVQEPLTFTAMGRDLLQTRTNSAYFAYGTVFGWIENDVFLFRTSDGDGGLNMTVNPPHEEYKPCVAVPEICGSNLLKARAFLNASIDLLQKNLVYPPKAL